jgi:acyl-CoA thioester hydrolase
VPTPGEQRIEVRVYYEDTDLAGIVYYANYLKYLERGRTEALEALGVDQAALKADGLVFAVQSLTIDYVAPARFLDRLVVATRSKSVGGARVVLAQDVLRDGAVLARAVVGLACLTPDGRPARLPAEVRAALALLGSDAP